MRTSRNKIGVTAEGALQGGHCLFMASHQAIGKAQSEYGEEGVMRIEAQCLLSHLNGFLWAPRKVAAKSQPRVPISIVGTEGDSLLAFGDGQLMLLLPQIEST